jgi:hypothetical protein
MKTVKDLKKELEGVDDNLPVVVYTAMGEDMEDFHEVRIESRATPDNWSYCKGDHILSYRKGLDKVVVIG